MSFIRHYLLAIQFFTRIPITGRLADWVGYSPAMLRASGALPGGPVGRWWPAGLCGGGIAFRQNYAAGGSGACTIATVMLTGGFHEDGYDRPTGWAAAWIACARWKSWDSYGAYGSTPHWRCFTVAAGCIGSIGWTWRWPRCWAHTCCRAFGYRCWCAPWHGRRGGSKASCWRTDTSNALLAAYMVFYILALVYYALFL